MSQQGKEFLYFQMCLIFSEFIVFSHGWLLAYSLKPVRRTVLVPRLRASLGASIKREEPGSAHREEGKAPCILAFSESYWNISIIKLIIVLFFGIYLITY